MCLITAAPKGTVKTAEALANFIKSGMQTNTHGSGFAYKRNGNNKVNLSKGYKSPESIIEAIGLANLQEDDELIIHHRIGTSGLQNDINMHPFLISDDIEVMRNTFGEFDLPVMAHNGVINEFSEYTSDYNDTFLFVNEFMSGKNILKCLKETPVKFKIHYKDLIQWEKLAFLFPDKDMILLGHFVEDNGYFHSNGGYNRIVYDKGGSSTQKGKDYPKHLGRSLSEIRKEEGIDDEHPYSEGFTNPQIGLFPEEQTASPVLIRPIEDKIISLGDNTVLDSPKGFKENKIITLNPNKTYEGNLLFTDGQIKINSKNYQHFIIVPTKDIASTVHKFKGYEMENYDENSQLNYVYSKDSEQVMRAIDIQRHFDLGNLKLFVKHEKRDAYTDLRKFLNQYQIPLSKSMMKKLEKKCNIKIHSDIINLKQYGYFFRWDLLNLVEISKISHAISKESIGVPSEDNVITNEDFMS